MEKPQILELYRRRARRYDLTANLYYLIGYREWAYRRRAVAALGLRPGDTVVEVCCGTGLNFSLLEEAVGPEGRVIGVDMTDAMLKEAEKRLRRRGWRNVELVHADAARYQFPRGVNGIISTFAISLIPEYDDIIRRGGEALAPGGRFVVLDLKKPTNWLSALTPLFLFLIRPFGGTREALGRAPWESIGRHFKRSSVEERYGGISYIATGEAAK
jgi:ubiquinone/menaquinone biosynthesis C-methylase UbiE